ncbi:MAG TPA: hypothetical protein V6C69_10690 [Trichormus sp.]
MFLLVDSSPYAQVEPCSTCKTLIEVGPPPMSQEGPEIVKPAVPCRHNKPAYELPHLMGDGRFAKNCA